MAELDPFGAPAGAPGGPALGNGVAGAGEEDPAAAFLAQQESEIAGIENDEAFAILDGGAPGPQPHGEPPGGPGERAAAFGREDLRAHSGRYSYAELGLLAEPLEAQRGSETPSGSLHRPPLLQAAGFRVLLSRGGGDRRCSHQCQDPGPFCPTFHQALAVLEAWSLKLPHWRSLARLTDESESPRK